MSWFIDPNNQMELVNDIDESAMINNSRTLFSFARQGRFNDSFLFELRDNVPIYYISNEGFESNGGILRFWDVFIKWGQELQVIEKFNLKNIDYQLSVGGKSLVCIYFKRDIAAFNLIDYLLLNYKSNYINVPKLVFKISIEFRYSIESIKRMIITESRKNSHKLSLQRTSEIFIRNTEINLVPVVDNFYISHILLLQ